MKLILLIFIITQTQTESGTEVLQRQAECKYKFVHTEYDIKWISSCAFEFEKTTTINP